MKLSIVTALMVLGVVSAFPKGEIIGFCIVHAIQANLCCSQLQLLSFRWKRLRTPLQRSTLLSSKRKQVDCMVSVCGHKLGLFSRPHDVHNYCDAHEAKGASHEAHCDAFSMCTSKSNWMRIDRVHMAQQLSRFEANCDKHGCYQLTRMMLKDCSEACSASTAGCTYVKTKYCRQWNHRDYFTMLYHTSWPSENKPLSSPMSLQGQNRKERYNTCHKPIKPKILWVGVPLREL